MWRQEPQRNFEADFLDFLYCWHVILGLFPNKLEIPCQKQLEEEKVNLTPNSRLQLGSPGSKNLKQLVRLYSQEEQKAVS